MSAIITLRIQADTAKFQDFVSQNPDTLRAIGEEARSKGCQAHQFGVGDGFVLVVDEWESAEQFQSFFEGNPQIGEVMRGAGAQGEPQVTVAEAVDSADRF